MSRSLRHTLLAFLCAVSFARGASTTNMPVDGYAAIVDDRVITVGDVIDLIQPTELELRDSYDGDELTRKREEAFKTGRDLLIEQALILEEFKKQGANVPDRLVNDRINEFIFERFQNDRAKFLAALADEQITLDEWRDRIRERIVVSYLRRQEVFDKVEIAPGAVLEAYERDREKYQEPAQVRLRLIVVKKTTDEDQAKAAREKAVLARGRLLAGEEFAAIAREVSEDSKAESGGDWGWLEPKLLREELRAAAEKLQAGDTSEVIETPEAFYLVHLEERKEARTRTLDEARADIVKGLERAESERLYRQWIDRLKRKHTVQVF